ncbi:MAG: hypothetical protein JNK47_14155 [Mesorhizobium sp.]|nr:hypothetical protein [Mesorhizobium sp.]MBL8578363.1 hypothetical protein [Mesorhizobium sp.]
MAKVSDLPDNPDAESKFRQGYTHGVEAVLLAVEDKLTPADKAKLAAWKNRLLDWRTSWRDGFREAPPPPALD